MNSEEKLLNGLDSTARLPSFSLMENLASQSACGSWYSPRIPFPNAGISNF